MKLQMNIASHPSLSLSLSPLQALYFASTLAFKSITSLIARGPAA